VAGMDSKLPESAQDAYKTLLRVRVAPDLRKLGFKGSGNSFSMARGDYGVGVYFQKNKWSTRESVTFDVNVSVGHQPTNEAYEIENVAARQLGKELQFPSNGFWERLSHLGGKPDFPWAVTPGGPNDEAAEEVLTAIRTQFLPRVDMEVVRPLKAPTPAKDRADRPSQQAINEAAWEWHRDALERSGVINLERVDQDPESG